MPAKGQSLKDLCKGHADKTCGHFGPRPNTRAPYERIFQSARRHGPAFLKQRLSELGIELKCYGCGLGPEWEDNPLVLQIDHINGDHNDNQLENLRFLCPNCHAQTPTWNRKKKFRNFEPPVSEHNILAELNKNIASQSNFLVELGKQTGEFIGFMRAQDKLNESFGNDIPHLRVSVGKLEGKFKIIIWALGVIIVFIGASGALNVFLS